MAKKLKHRGAELKARDLFDLAVVIEREPKCLPILAPILAEQKSVVVQRLVDREAALREDFAQLDTLGAAPTYDECVARVRALFKPSGKPPRKRRAVRR